MTLNEILEDYISIRETGNGFEIYVTKIHWAGPHKTKSEWVLAYKKEYNDTELEENELDLKFLNRRIDDDGRIGLEIDCISDPDIRIGIEKVLDRKAFFKTCDDCGVRNHTFHMEGRICNSCIPEVAGLVY